MTTKAEREAHGAMWRAMTRLDKEVLALKIAHVRAQHVRDTRTVILAGLVGSIGGAIVGAVLAHLLR